MTTALLFDAHGVLVDLDGCIRGYLQPLLAKSGHSDGARVPTVDEWMARFSRISEKLRVPYRRHGELVCAAYEAAMRHFDLEAFVDDGPGLARALSEAPVAPSAKSILRALSKRFRLGVVGDTDVALLGAALGRLHAPLTVVVAAEEVRAYKPAPALWSTAIARLGRAPETILYVTTKPSEIEPARALGLDVAVVATLAELPTLLPQ